MISFNSQVLEAPTSPFPQPLTPMKLNSQGACWLPPKACITTQVYRGLKQWCHKDYKIHTPFYKKGANDSNVRAIISAGLSH